MPAIHPDEGRLTRSKYRWQTKKHIVLLFICGTVFIELGRECLLTDAYDMLYNFKGLF